MKEQVMLPKQTHVLSDYIRLLHTHPSVYHHPAVQQEMLHNATVLGPRFYDLAYAAGVFP